MATDSKDFKIKNGLIVQGATATVNGNNVITEASSIADISDVDTSGATDLQALVYNASTGTWIPGEAVGGGSGSYTISATAPESPEAGDVWFDSTDGKSYIYYDDGDTTQWLEIGSRQPGPTGATGSTGPQGDPGRFFTSDTAPENPVDGDVWFNSSNGVILVYYTDVDSSQWVESGYPILGYQTLSGLTDTNISSPSDNQVLSYDNATSKWVNATPASTLGSLTDVDTTGVAEGQALVYDSANSEWVAGTVSSGGVKTLSSDGIDIDFSDSIRFEKRSVGGDVVFTGSNYTAGIDKKILLEGNGSANQLTFPQGWNFLSDAPSSIGANKDNVLELSCFGTTEASVFATWTGPDAFSPIVATGGTITEETIGATTYRIHTFATTDTFTVSDAGANGEVEYLVVAGGGGAGAKLQGQNGAANTGGGAGGGGGHAAGGSGGGGGAGGYRCSVSGEDSGGLSIAESKASIAATTYIVTVGAGGANNGSEGNTGTQGSNSEFGDIVSIGGGRGAGATQPGGSGGSGGGADGRNQPGGTGTNAQGFAGGASGDYQPSIYPGGGGGGAGGAGTAGSGGSTPGNGGVGIASNINGTLTHRAGGGGAGNGGTGGNGGGGDGGPGLGQSQGGSGVVIVRYPITNPN